MTFISILIPCLNEERYIEKCLNSLIKSDLNKEEIEIFVLDGMSSDGTRNIVKKISKNNNYIFLIDNKKKNVPAALNLGVKLSKGDYIVRLDAHSSYPKNYITGLIKWHSKIGNADNVGCIVETDVLNKTTKTLVIKNILSHKFGVGNSEFRVGITKLKETDTVPFGCFKREVFENFGTFNPKLLRNQDIEFNKRIINNGGKVFLVPNLSCTYYARETFSSIFNNNYNNGYWNILTLFYTNSFNSLSIRHLIPLFFVLSFIIPPILSIINFNFLILSFISIILYFIPLFYYSIKLSNSIKSFNYFIYGFIGLHLSYGFGSLISLFKIPFIKR